MSKYYTATVDGSRSLVIGVDGVFYDTSPLDEPPRSYVDLVRSGRMAGVSVAALTDRIVEASARIERDQFWDDLVLPIEMDEVWAAGVTYRISTDSREGSGSVSETYLDAYESERPEIYFKATPSRTVGPGEPVGIRSDSAWDVPEPEMAIVLYHGEVVGFTVGNDMCSREIERDNLLYLPQSKIYKQSCAVGPCIARVGDPHSLDVRMWIDRDGTEVFEGETSTEEMVRLVDELVSYFRQCNEVPETAVLLTGTSIIPPDDFTLEPGDVVNIDIEEIGTLTNPVETV